MKKNFTKILLACVLCVMALCMAASAEKVTLLPDDEGKFTATYQGVAGEYYAILIVEGTYTEDQTPVISEDTITYISQETAGADGKAVFSKFIPKDPLVNGTVYIGGSDSNLEDGAILFGYLKTGEEETATVSGTVTSSADSTWATKVVMTDTTDATATYEITTETGAYSITLPLGTYKMEITKTAHLSYTDNSVEVAGDVAYADVELKAGDADMSTAVGVDDITAVVNYYGESTGFTASYDIDNSGSIGIDDLTAIIINYGTSATVID